MFSGIGVPELVLIGIVAVLLFGQRLPQVARNIGRSYRDLRQSLNEIRSSIDFDESPSSRDSTPSYSRDPSPPARYEADEDDVPAAPKLKPPDESES